MDLGCRRYWFFKWFLQLKIQINSKKPGFARKNQLRTWSKLKAYHSIQAWFLFIFHCSKNWSIHFKTMYTCSVSLFCNGFTLGPTAHATLVYVWRKVVCLYCFVLFCLVCNYEIHQTGMLQIVILVSLESSQPGGVHQLGSMTFGLAVGKFLNIEWFLHRKLN